MPRETRVQSKVNSYQRLKKWFLIPPCLTHIIISLVSRVKWSNPGKVCICVASVYVSHANTDRFYKTNSLKFSIRLNPHTKS